MIAITNELYWLVGLGMIGNMVISLAILKMLIRLLKLKKPDKDEEKKEK